MSSIKSNDRSSFFPVNRVEALADGVFAIVMTILVLELSIPVVTGGPANTELLRKLLDLWPELSVYVLSFILIGMMWVHHRFMFHYIARSDSKLAWLNIILLMFAALIPFAASLLGAYINLQVAVVAYGIIALLNVVMSLVIWIYITGKHELADVTIDTETAMQRKYMYVVGSLFFILGICISFISSIASLCVYGLTALLSIIISWRDSHGYLSILFMRLREKRKKL